MPLDANLLSQLITTNVGQLGSDSSETNQQYNEGVKKLADAIAKAVVQHITTAGIVEIPAGAVIVVTPQGNGNNPAPVMGVIK